MITEELIDELVQRFNGFNRDGEHGILRFLNQAHFMLMTQEAQQTLIFDETSGRLPFLNTTAGTRQYIMPSNVWRIASVLIKADSNLPAYDYGFGSNQFGMQRQLRVSYENMVSIGGVFFVKIPYIRSWDYVNSSILARMMFTEDPGTKSDYYYRQSYKLPTQILSESIQPDMPPPFDTDYLIPATAKLIEGMQSGNYDEARRIINLELKPAMWKQLDSGDQGYLDMEPVDRGF